MSSQYAIASITNLVVIFCHVSMSVSCSRQISWPTDKDRVGFIAVLVLSWMDEFATAWCNCGHYEFAAEKLVLSLLNGLLDPAMVLVLQLSVHLSVDTCTRTSIIRPSPARSRFEKCHGK